MPRKKIIKICKGCREEIFVNKNRKFCSSECFYKWNVKQNNSMFGKNHSKKSKTMMGKNRKGKVAWNRGLTKEGDERVMKYSKKIKGRKVSLESIKKQKETKKRLYKEGKLIPWNKGLKGFGGFFIGKTHLEESKRKISAKLQGVPLEKWEKFIKREPYDYRWINKFKREIRKRENYICMLCGIHQERLSEALTIHHINYNKKLSIPQTCCAICRKCHSKTNTNRKHWVKFFQSLLAERYGYQYSKEEIILNLNNIIR